MRLEICGREYSPVSAWLLAWCIWLSAGKSLLTHWVLPLALLPLV